MNTRSLLGLSATAALLLFARVPTSYAEHVLEGHVAELEDAMHAWDFGAITNAADRIDRSPVNDDEERFWRDYWHGVGLLHAVLSQRETSDPDKKLVADLREQAIATLQRALELRPQDGESHAMIALLQGLAISDRPLSAFVRGRKLEHHKRIAEQADSSPRITYLLGVSRLNMARRAAKVEEAHEDLLKAIELYDEERTRDRLPLEPRWGRAHALMFAGVASERIEHREEAAAWYKKALQENPKLRRAKEGDERCRRTASE